MFIAPLRGKLCRCLKESPEGVTAIMASHLGRPGLWCLIAASGVNWIKKRTINSARYNTSCWREDNTRPFNGWWAVGSEYLSAV